MNYSVLVLLGVAFLIALFDILICLKRGFLKSLVRVLTQVFSAVAAFIAARILAAKALTQLLDNMEEQIPDGGAALAEFAKENPVVMENLSGLLQMLIAPLLFFFLYLILKFLTLFLYLIIAAFLPEDKLKGSTAGRWTGFAFGVVSAIIGVVVLLVPVMGYATVADTVVAAMPASASEDLTTYDEEYVAPTLKTPILSSLYRSIGAKVFDGLTTVEIDGEKAVLLAEITAIGNTIKDVAPLGETELAAYSTKEADALKKATDDIDASVFQTSLLSTMLNSASNSWLDGKSFLGVQKPALGDTADILMHGVLTTFSTSTSQNLGGDLDTIAELFSIFARHGVFASLSSGPEAMAEKLITTSALNEAMAELGKNERMKPVKDALYNVAFQTMIQGLGSPAEYAETCAEVINEMADALQSVTDETGNVDKDALAERIDAALQTKDVVLSEPNLKLIADGIADTFTAEELKTLTPEEIADRLIERFTDADVLSTVHSYGY